MSNLEPARIGLVGLRRALACRLAALSSSAMRHRHDLLLRLTVLGQATPRLHGPIRAGSWCRDMSGSEYPDITTLGGPLDDRRPLYSRVAALAAEHPELPLPRGGNDLVDRRPEPPRPIGPLEPSERRGVAEGWHKPRLIRALGWYFHDSGQDRAALCELYPELLVAGSHLARDAVQAGAAGRPPDAAAALGRWLARYAADDGPVSVGLWLLAEAGEPADRELITTLGLLDDVFNPEAVQALRATQPDPDRAVYLLARRLRDWGLVYAVEALRGTGDPEIKRWMVREVGGWGLIYYCDVLAGTGDLFAALRDGPVDEQLLDNAGAILSQLCDTSVQTRGIEEYPDAPAALATYRMRVATAPPTLARLAYLTDLEKSVHDGRAARLDWSPGERESLLAGYAGTLAEPGWAAAVRAGLDSGHDGERWTAFRYAARVGVSTARLLLDRLVDGSADRWVPWETLGECAEDLLPEAVRRLSALLLTEPPTAGWSAAHQALGGLLPRLAEHPGLGSGLVDYAGAVSDGSLRRQAAAVLAAWRRG